MKRLILALAFLLAYAVPASAQLNCVIYNGNTICTSGVTFGGPVKLPNGTAGAPSLAWGTSANSGFFYDGSYVYFVSGGTQYWKFFGNELAAQNGAYFSFASATSGGDVFISRGASGSMRLGTTSSGSDGTWNAGSYKSTAAAVTVGSGTGVTVNNAGELRTQVYKVTVAASQFISASTNHDVTLATLPAKTFITHILADVTQTFACTATCTSSTLSMTVGSAAGGNQYLVSFDVDAATGQFGDAAAELGASLTEATIPTAIGAIGSWASTSPVSLRMTSGTGNLGTGAATNLSQGSVTVYIFTTVMP